MMHGHEKSDLVIVAMKPANKAREAHRGGVCGGGRSGVGGAKGGGQGEYAPRWFNSTSILGHGLPPSAREARRKAGAEAGRSGATHSPPDEVNSRNVNLLGRPNRALESVKALLHQHRKSHRLEPAGRRSASRPPADPLRSKAGSKSRSAANRQNFLDVIHRAA